MTVRQILVIDTVVIAGISRDLVKLITMEEGDTLYWARTFRSLKFSSSVLAICELNDSGELELKYHGE